MLRVRHRAAPHRQAVLALNPLDVLGGEPAAPRFPRIESMNRARVRPRPAPAQRVGRAVGPAVNRRPGGLVA